MSLIFLANLSSITLDQNIYKAESPICITSYAVVVVSGTQPKKTLETLSSHRARGEFVTNWTQDTPKPSHGQKNSKKTVKRFNVSFRTVR